MKMDINEIDNWPASWKITSKDTAYGKKLIRLMKPFITELSNTYTSRTVKMHADNLWLLGGYTIERINRNEKYRKTEPCLFLTTFMDFWDGPMIRDLSEKEQSSLDATCRKFYKYLVENVLNRLIS